MKDQQSIAVRQLLTGIVGNAPLGILTLSLNHEVSMINAEAVRLLGFAQSPPEKLLDKPYHKAFIHTPEMDSNYASKIIRCGERKFDLENLAIGEYIVKVQCRCMLQGALFLIEDITQRIQTEEKLQSEKRLKLATRAGGIGIWDYDLVHNVRFHVHTLWRDA
jgi:hypothetical protein